MNVLLIQPPLCDFYRTALRTQPLGLAYLAAALRQHGHRPEILDCLTPDQQRAPVPAQLAHMRGHYRPGDLTPFRLYGHYNRFGLPPGRIQAHIAALRPDIVGLQCQFTPYVSDTLAVAAQVKAAAPLTPVVVGGAHASCLPARLLADPSVDYVVLGEGEQTLPRLLHALQEGNRRPAIDGLAYRDSNGGVCVIPRTAYIEDLDSLPLPARDLLDLSAYKIGGQRYTMLLTSRGCPQGCTYCSVAALMGNRLRTRSIANILYEIEHCVREHGIQIFDIEDDNFTWDKKRARALLDAVHKRFGSAGIGFTAMNGMSLLSLDDELLAGMQRAAFLHLDLALGSAVPDKNIQMGRSANRKKADRALAAAAACGFPLTTYILLGVPGHRLDDMLASIFYLADRPTMIGPSIFYPSPGTQLYGALDADELRAAGSEVLLRSSAFPVETDDFCRLDIVTLLRTVRWINFIKRHLSAGGHADRSLAAVLQEAKRWWPNEVPRAAGERYVTFSAPLTAPAAGKIATALLCRHWTFYGIKRVGNPNKDLYTYHLFLYNTSSKIMRALQTYCASGSITAAHIKPAGLGSKEIACTSLNRY